VPRQIRTVLNNIQGFWADIGGRALDRTLEHFSKGVLGCLLLVTVIPIIAVCSYLLSTLVNDPSENQAWTTVLTGLFTAGLTSVLIGAIWLFEATVQGHAYYKNRRLSDLHDARAELSKMRNRTLRLTFDEIGRGFRVPLPKGKAGLVQYRLAVLGTGKEAIAGSRVLVSSVSVDGILQKGMMGLLQPGEQSVPPGSIPLKFVDLVVWNPKTHQMSICFSDTLPVEPIGLTPDRQCTISLSVQGDNTQDCPYEAILKRKDDGISINLNMPYSPSTSHKEDSQT
jgi:hypothetical protein